MCVTSNHDIDKVIALAKVPGVIIATFGDMTRVPGSTSSLLAEQAAGADVRIVYSPLDALAIARENPDREVVFVGVGFSELRMRGCRILASSPPTRTCREPLKSS